MMIIIMIMIIIIIIIIIIIGTTVTITTTTMKPLFQHDNVTLELSACRVVHRIINAILKVMMIYK